MSDLDKKIIDIFKDVAIRKSLTKKVGLTDRALPSFIIDWLVSRYMDQNGNLNIGKVNTFIEKHLPDRTKKQLIYDRLFRGEKVKIIDAYKVEIDLKRGEYKLLIPCLDINNAEISSLIIEENPKLLLGNVWGIGTLQYTLEEGKEGKVSMIEFKPMESVKTDLDYFIQARQNFTLQEWMDLIIKTMGYNPNFYTEQQKIWMIARLTPFVHPRINLIELAPKGTGKSSVFSKLSRYCWLISGGIVTRAQLFYNMAEKRAGIIAFFDTIVLDEVQTIRFQKPEEIIGALKGYLASGEFKVMGYQGTAEAGFVLLANIPMNADNRPKSKFLFETLPYFCRETAFLDRFHGFLPGWDLPKIKKGTLEYEGYALRADYFSEILHQLRSKNSHLEFVKRHISFPSEAYIRDVKAVESLTAALLKLLFPDLNLDLELLNQYCLRPAFLLRKGIKGQLNLVDPEYPSEVGEYKLLE